MWRCEGRGGEDGVGMGFEDDEEEEEGGKME